MRQAYKVTDTEENLCVFEFAEDEQAALKSGAWELTSEPEYCEVARAPEWDGFAGLGYIPPKVLIETAGWQFQCWQCSAEIYWDCGFTVDDEDDEPQPVEPVFDRQAVWCCSKCHTAWTEERDRAKQLRSEAFDSLSAKFPGITDLKVHGEGTSDLPIYASFRAAGCLGEIDWRSDQPDTVLVQVRDVEAWKAFKEAIDREAAG